MDTETIIKGVKSGYWWVVKEGFPVIVHVEGSDDDDLLQVCKFHSGGLQSVKSMRRTGYSFVTHVSTPDEIRLTPAQVESFAIRVAFGSPKAVAWSKGHSMEYRERMRQFVRDMAEAMWEAA